MKFCVNCGEKIKDGASVCLKCGKAVEGAAAEQADVDNKDNSKTMAILAYILFFIPLITGDHKKSDFVKFHANQGTILWIVAVAYSILSTILKSVIRVTTTTYIWGLPVETTVTPGWLSAILWIGNVAITVLAVLGIVNAVKGQKKELPVIGKFTVIK